MNREKYIKTLQKKERRIWREIGDKSPEIAPLVDELIEVTLLLEAERKVKSKERGGEILEKINLLKSTIWDGDLKREVIDIQDIIKLLTNNRMELLDLIK